MLRKISLTLVLLLLIGCSNVPTKNTSLTPQEQSLQGLIYDWKIDEANELLGEIGLTLTDERVKKYSLEIREKEKEYKELEKTIEILKGALSKNHIFIVERYTQRGIKNKIKLKELEKIDFSRGKIYTSKPKFQGDTANVLAVINFYDDSLYLDILFEIKDDRWKIIDFSERG
jgi:hypothetical protein